VATLLAILPELIPWAVLLVIFFGEKLIQWRLISALDRALARVSVPPVPTPIPVAPANVQPLPAPVPSPIPLPLPVPTATPPAVVINGPFGLAPSWFQWALHEIGFHETGNNQGLERYISLAHTGAEGDAWCAIFVNAALESSGIMGSRSPSSQSFRSNANFVQLAGPCLGAIVVFWRGTQSSGLGHVAFYRGENADEIWALGGNESDMVQIEALPKSSASFGVIGYYWPKSVPLPAIAPVIMPGGSPTSVQVAPTVLAPSVSTNTDPSAIQTSILATMFGSMDSGKYQSSAYGGPIIDTSPGVALPARFSGTRPKVRVTGKSSGVSVDCEIVDIGPWNIHDPYWQTGARPQSESGTDMTDRKTNKAGIDLTMAAAQAVGIDGKGLVDWQFITGPATSPKVT
jgi:uncharacterized protein (TIGR02594 family)